LRLRAAQISNTGLLHQAFGVSGNTGGIVGANDNLIEADARVVDMAAHTQLSL
jgi:hypothetical protein